MQSGRAKTKSWVLEFMDPDKKYREPVMGWSATESTSYQTKIYFDSLEEALEYCETKAISPTILSEQEKASIPKSYADNFTKGLRF